MNLFEKILGALHLNFLNRKNSPSQRNVVQIRNSSSESIQQAGGDIYNDRLTGTPQIEVSSDSSVGDFANQDKVNIYIRKISQDPLIIMECTFDGVVTNHASKKLEDKDVFHFETVKKENITDGYEPLFMLKVRKQTGEEFLFKSKLQIKLFGNRYDLMVTGDETIERL